MNTRPWTICNDAPQALRNQLAKCWCQSTPRTHVLQHRHSFTHTCRHIMQRRHTYIAKHAPLCKQLHRKCCRTQATRTRSQTCSVRRIVAIRKPCTQSGLALETPCCRCLSQVSPSLLGAGHCTPQLTALLPTRARFCACFQERARSC